ncbi:hypothetical protein GUJ93_ZPchr0006g45768 [Zizania palustris]|uniref:Uncharacterized protein n=1 Tax=Zizania palustris TaxID=103762 RepID=A0A8J5VPI7_ZIZPA|nr:hypothetical protein GUJ93_ZPchr0006g45768 [Zizania palustris]KAG8075195.1 hypothetical protein GUJ93_ZPchr0006g45768 [Zizania palustris]
MHQIGSGMYVSGPVDRRKERRLSSGSVATPPYTGGDVSRSGELGRMFDIAATQSQVASPASSRRSSGPLPRPVPSPASGPLSQLSHSGLLVGPSPSPAPSPAPGGSERKASRMRPRQQDEAAAAAAVARGRARLSVPVACYVLVTVVAVAGVGAGVFCLLTWHRWEALAAAGGVVAAVAAVFACNVRRTATEAERFFRRLPDTVLDHSDMPIGELVKITGQVTCGHHPLGARFHNAARCVFTSVQLYERRRRGCYSSRWQPRHSEVRAASIYRRRSLCQPVHRLQEMGLGFCWRACVRACRHGRRVSTSRT